MAPIPENTVTMEDLIAWQALAEQLSKVKAAEMLLRVKIFKGKFVDPKEGTNKVPLNDGWVLNGERKIDRKVDIAMVNALAIPDGPFVQAGINPALLIDWKPELKLSAYRELTVEQREVFDQALTIKDGSPTLKIVLPAAAAKAQAAKAGA